MYAKGTHVMWHKTRFEVVTDDGKCHNGQPNTCKHIGHRPLTVYEVKEVRSDWVRRWQTTNCIPGDETVVCD